MYGKIFDTIYDGTLYGHWEAIVTFQQFIVLSDADGVVDMTPHAMAARTSIPLEILFKGIKILEQPDPYTRTPGEDGRRIILMDDHRPWGWVIVNHAKYKAMRNADQKREADRVRIAEKRKQIKNVAITSQCVANVAHTDTDTDTDTDKRTITPPPPSGAFLKFWGVWPKSIRKGAKGECWKKWARNDLDLVSDQILAHVEALKASKEWRDPQYIPAPLAYLNKKRWEGAEAPEPRKEEWHV
jgi:hypothetical protein